MESRTLPRTAAILKHYRSSAEESPVRNGQKRPNLHRKRCVVLGALFAFQPASSGTIPQIPGSISMWENKGVKITRANWKALQKAQATWLSLFLWRYEHPSCEEGFVSLTCRLPCSLRDLCLCTICRENN